MHGNSSLPAHPDDRPMRIALVMPADTRHIGGVQRFAVCLSEALQRLGDIEVVSLHPNRDEKRTPVTRLVAQVRGLRRLRRLILSSSVDVVMTTYHWPPAVSRRVPTIGYVHDLRGWGLHQPHAGHDSVSRRCLKFCLRQVWSTWSALAVPSRHVERDVLAVGPRCSVQVVPEGLDHLHRYESAMAPHRSRILVLGGSAPHKRASLGLEVGHAAGKVFGMGVDFVGTLPDGREAPMVVAHPQASDETVVQLARSAKVVIAATSYEGFGLAVGEAMWFGAPIVYAEDARLDDLVGAGGLACPPTVDGFLDAAGEVLADSDTFSKAAESVARQYRWDVTATMLLDAASNAVHQTRKTGAGHG